MSTGWWLAFTSSLANPSFPHLCCWTRRRLFSTTSTSTTITDTLLSDSEPIETLEYPVDLDDLFIKELARQQTEERIAQLHVPPTPATLPCDTDALKEYLFRNNFKDALALLFNEQPDRADFPLKTKNGVYKRIGKLKPSLILPLLEPYMQYVASTEETDSAAARRIRQGLRDMNKFWNVDKLQALFHACSNDRLRTYLFSLLTIEYRSSHAIQLLLSIPSHLTAEATLHLHNTAMDTALKQKRLDHVERVALQMKQLALIPDAASFNVWIRAKIMEKGMDEAEAIYNDMLSRQVEPTIATYNTFLSHICKHQQWHALDKWLQSIHPKAKPNSITVRILLNALTEHNEMHIASVFDRVLSLAILNKDSEYFLNTSIAMLLRLKRTDMAFTLLHKLFHKKENLSIYAYNILLHGLVQKGKVWDAHQLILSMEEDQERKLPLPDIVSYTTLIHGYIRGAASPHLVDLPSILEVYKRMLSRGVSTNEVFRSVLMYGLLRCGLLDITSAQHLFEMILEEDKISRRTDKASHTILYNIMMDGYFIYHHTQSKAGERVPPKGPYHVLEMALKAGVPLTVSTLNIWIRGLGALNDEWAEAERMMEWFESIHIMMNERTVWYFVNMAYRRKQYDKALAWLKKYEDRGRPVCGQGLVYIKGLLEHSSSPSFSDPTSSSYSPLSSSSSSPVASTSS
ncbi:hypothetical protein BDF14DRAFT_1745225 [Spinellus fusiger]|nr:hypothetical protein BDF14DRAFT_1745225 [Spinellus fusiger]